MFKSPRPRLVRFSDFHPAHNPEAYCYNLLLKHRVVRDEALLISAENTTASYLTECYLQKIIAGKKVGPKLQCA